MMEGYIGCAVIAFMLVLVWVKLSEIAHWLKNISENL